MNESSIVRGIRSQMKRMRSAQIEPEEICVSVEAYKLLGKPRLFYGIPISCDSRQVLDWIVR